MTKLLPEPPEIEVTLGPQLEPASLHWRRWRAKVIAIHNYWRVEDDWWHAEVARDYYKVQTDDGTLCIVYKDRREDKWYLQRIYD